MRYFGLIRFEVLILLFISATAISYGQGRRKALIIGNGAYSGGDSLSPTTINDANAVYEALQVAGFDKNDMQREFNLDHDEMVTVLAAFTNGLQPDDKAIFYFSGHGFSLGAENYLVPIGFEIGSTQTETLNRAISLNKVINRMLAAKTQVIILDACRDEPEVIKQLPMAITNTPPMKQMVQKESEGTLIAFAAASGKKADATPIDGKSIFTYYLVKNLAAGYGDLQNALDKTRDSVANASLGRQHPGIYNDLQGDFPLGQPLPTAIVSASLTPQSVVDALRRNISRTTKQAAFIYSFHVWKIWLALPQNLQDQVEKVTYTFPNGYVKPGNTRWGDLNRPLGLTSWLANSCGTGEMQADVKLKNSPDHVIAKFDLCKVPESSDIPATIKY